MPRVSDERAVPHRTYRRRSTLTAFLLALSAVTVAFAGFLAPPAASAYTPHAPIYINGNTDFTPANGVTGGSGTPLDPYIIEGWEINASTAHGIRILGTTADYIIRDVYVHSGGTLFDGILITGADNGVVENATITDNARGINLNGVTNVTVIANNVSSNNQEGVFGYSSSDIRIAANNVSWNGLEGIHVELSTNATFTANNVFSNPGNGIRLESSNRATFTANNLSSNGGGISLWESTNAILAANIFSSNGVYLGGTSLAHHNSHTITTDNSVNGKPLYYHKDCISLTVDSIPVGQLLVVNCTDVVLTNLQIADTDMGIRATYSTRVTVASNDISNNAIGIVLEHSIDVRITANNLSSNDLVGIALWDATTNVSIADNRAWDNWIGIEIVSTQATVARNIVSASTGRGGYGIRVESTANNVTISANQILNTQRGIFLQSATAVSVNANNVSTTTAHGISIGSSTNITVMANNVSSDAQDGVRVESSTDVTLAGNAIFSSALGIEVVNSIGVLVHNNNLISNAVQAADDNGPQNLWDDSYPSGGNYWSDYGGIDLLNGPNQDQPGPDGIGDTPYVIDADSQDRYPFMNSSLLAVAPRLLSATLSGAGNQDLDLAWERSADEGLLGGTVTYRVLRSLALSGPFAEIASVPANGSLTYLFNCLGCGHVLGDVNLTFYRIQAVTSANSTADSDLAARYATTVRPGSHLLSVPLEQTDYSLPAVLPTISYGTVRVYDSTDSVDPWKAVYSGRSGDLATTTFGQALWVDVTALGQYTIAGLVDAAPSFALVPGWNLVGYASFSPETLPASLAGVAGVGRVETFDPSVAAEPYRLRAVPMSELLVPGAAYWIHVAGAGGLWQQG